MIGDVGMHHAKKQEVPLATLSRILAQSCIILGLNKRREQLCMIVLVSVIVSTIYRMVHPYITIDSVE